MKLYKKLILEALGLRKWFYIIALLIIFIPIAIVMVSNVGFSDSFSKIFLSIAIIMIIIGKALTACSRAKGDNNVHNDIAAIIALIIILFSNLFRG